MRSKLIEKYGDSCNFCGEKNLVESGRISFDHIEPFSKGGSGDFDNLQILCSTCNTLKSNRSQNDFEKYMKIREETPKMVKALSDKFPEIEEDADFIYKKVGVERIYRFIK